MSALALESGMKREFGIGPRCANNKHSPPSKSIGPLGAFVRLLSQCVAAVYLYACNEFDNDAILKNFTIFPLIQINHTLAQIDNLSIG